MPRRYKLNACLTLLLAVLFLLFFQISKHQPALAGVNAFAEDPYDAVGSFGVQFAVFTALLALIRAFRSYKTKAGGHTKSQEALLIGCMYLSCLSVAVTVLADALAMIRHPAAWVGVPAGMVLAALLAFLALCTLCVGWSIQHAAREIRPPFSSVAWLRACALALVSLLVLAFYPESMRQALYGELFTVVVGILCLFLPIRAIGGALTPSPGDYFEDGIDDLAAIYRWLKGHAGPCAGCFRPLEKLLAWPFLRAVLRWLNPRRHPWNFPLLAGIGLGLLLVLAEMSEEGGGVPRSGQLALVTLIFVSLETAGVLVGYALFTKPLGLVRLGDRGA